MPEWVYFLLAFLLFLANSCAVLTTLCTLPGNWIQLLMTACFALFIASSSGRGIELSTLLVCLALACAGEIAEFLAGAAGAARVGASYRGILLSLLGATAGSMVGIFMGVPIPLAGPIIGAIGGAALGAFGGAYLGELWKGRGAEERLAIGKGAFFGRLWGTVTKFAVGVVMVLVVAWDAFT